MEFMLILGLGLLVFFLGVMVVLGIFYKPPSPEQQKVNTEKAEVDMDKLESVLNFMLANGTIDHKQYNEMLRKSLPFI